MKKWNLFSVLFILAICFSACDNGNEPNPEDGNDGKTNYTFQGSIKMPDGDSWVDVTNEIDVLKATTEGSNNTIYGECEVNNGVFSIILTESIVGEELIGINDFFPWHGDSKDLKISDKNAKITSEFIFFDAYKNGTLVGYVAKETSSGSSKDLSVAICYVDRDVLVEGECSYTVANGSDYLMSINTNLKKGWNLIGWIFNDNDKEEVVAANNDITFETVWCFHKRD